MQADTSVSGQWHPDGAEFGEWCHTYHWASMPASSGRSISAEEGSHSFQLLSHVAVWMHEGHEMVNGVKGCYRLPCLRPQCSARDLHLPGAQFTKNLMNDVFHKFSQVCYKLIIRQPLMNSYDYNKIELDYRAKHSKLSSVSVLMLIANCSLALQQLYLLLPLNASTSTLSVFVNAVTQLSTSWSHISSQRQKLYHENVVQWLPALTILF